MPAGLLLCLEPPFSLQVVDKVIESLLVLGLKYLAQSPILIGSPYFWVGHALQK